jgi:hypothetical protein
LNIGVLTVAEFFFCLGDKRARMDSVTQFLLVERDARNINGLKPFLDFAFFALADIDGEGGA